MWASTGFGLGDERIAQVLRAAATAVFGDTVGWRVRATPLGFEWSTGAGHSAGQVGPKGSLMRLGVGAALLNARTALESLGVRPLVTLLPDPGRPDLLAVIQPGGTRRPGMPPARLRRVSGPRVIGARPVVHLPELAHAVRRERGWLHVVTDAGTQDRLRVLFARAGVLREPAEREDDVVEAVLCTHYPGALAELQAGQALQRMLNIATELGLTVPVLPWAVWCPAVLGRGSLSGLFRSSLSPHVVLRIGPGGSGPVPRYSAEVGDRQDCEA